MLRERVMGLGNEHRFYSDVQLAARRSLATMAEVQQIDAQAKAAAQQLEMETQARAKRLATESEVEFQPVKTEAEIQSLRAREQAAPAYSKHPALLRLQELETLRELARTANARIYINMDRSAAGESNGDRDPTT